MWNCARRSCQTFLAYVANDATMDDASICDGLHPIVGPFSLLEDMLVFFFFKFFSGCAVV